MKTASPTKQKKTLAKPSRWENMIRTILKKADPQTEARLFGDDQLTSATLLQQIKSFPRSISPKGTLRINKA